MDKLEYRSIGDTRHPEVTPAQTWMARFNSVTGTVFILLGGWCGWHCGIEYLKPLAEFFDLPLDQIDFVEIIPYIDFPVHFDADSVCRMAGMSLGAIVGLVMGVALEMILKHAKMLPAPIPRACDEIIDDDWVLELQPEQEDAVVVEAPPEIETVFKDMATKQQWSSPVNLKAKLVEIRDFILRYLWRREGFEVTIHCRNSFLYRSLRRKFVPEKLVYRVERKEDKTFIDEIEVVDYAEVYIVENGYATWMTAENNLTPWQMSCKTNGDELTLSFRLHKGLVIMIWVIAVIGFIVPLLLLTPALWIVPIFLLAILINGCLLKEIQKAQRVFTKRLRKIEAAYKKKVSSGK